MKLYYRSLCIVLLLAVVLAGLSLSATPTQAQDKSCKGLLKSLENVPPDSPAYEKIKKMAEEKCGEALDLAALTALYYSTGGENWWLSINWLSDTVHHCDWYRVTCNADRRVYQLYLYNNYLVGEIPPEFGNLSSLQYLFLTNNQLTSLPDSFGNLSSLTILELRNNQLTSLPDSIGNLTSLQQLLLYNNQLTSLPDSFGNLSSLQVLHLANNQLTSLPDSVGNLTSLVGLTLYNNQLTSLPDSVIYLSSLQYLWLADNPWDCFTATQKGLIAGVSHDINLDEYPTCGEES